MFNTRKYTSSYMAPDNNYSGTISHISKKGSQKPKHRYYLLGYIFDTYNYILTTDTNLGYI